MIGFYNPNSKMVIEADASSFGIGAVIRQQQPNGELRPIAYASRAMTPTETRYTQIEKEALAITWACERFSEYIVGMKFPIQMDHKPLIPLSSVKELEDVPARIQRVRLRLLRFHFTIEHIPGKELITADALSRSPTSQATTDDIILNEQVSIYVNQIVNSLPATKERLAEAQDKDEDMKLLRKYRRDGWPDRKQIPQKLQQYQDVSTELTEEQGLLPRGHRLINPENLLSEVLTSIHIDHPGITKCQEQARHSVLWPRTI